MASLNARASSLSTCRLPLSRYWTLGVRPLSIEDVDEFLPRGG